MKNESRIKHRKSLVALLFVLGSVLLRGKQVRKRWFCFVFTGFFVVETSGER